MERVKQPQGIYFSSSDSAIEHEITDGSFEDSLVFNLLFEPSLTMPDTFFFTNRFLIRHIEDGGDDSLFLRAVARGLIVPAFRYDTDLSFQESLRSIARDNAGGMEESNYAKLSPAVLAMRLDDAYNEAGELGIGDGSSRGGAPRRVWPTDLGSLFGDGFERVLLNDTPAITDEALLDRWRKIRHWRHDSIEVSRAATARLGGTGVRRHQLWNAVGWREGWLDRNSSFTKAYALLDAAYQAGGPEMRENAKLFLDAVNITYEGVQARQFGARHNIPPSLLGNSPVVVGSLDTPAAEGPTVFSVDLRLPETKALLAAGSTELLAIVREKGKEYFKTRDEWAAYPGPRTEERLREAVTAYADDLLTWSRGRQRPARFSAILTKIAPDAATVAGSIGAVAGDNLGLQPQYAIVSGLVTAAATQALTTTIELFSSRKRKVATRPTALRFETSRKVASGGWRELNLGS